MKFYKSTYSEIIDDLKKSYYFHNSNNFVSNKQHKINFKDKIELQNIKFLKKLTDVSAAFYHLYRF